MVIRPKELILNQLLRGHSFINRNPHRRPDDFESLNVRELTALSTPGSPDVYGYIILNSTIDVGAWQFGITLLLHLGIHSPFLASLFPSVLLVSFRIFLYLF